MSNTGKNDSGTNDPYRRLRNDDLLHLIGEISNDDEVDTDKLSALTESYFNRQNTPTVDVNAALQNFKNVQAGGDFISAVKIPEAQTPEQNGSRTTARRSHRPKFRRLMVAALVVVAMLSLTAVASAIPAVRQAIARWTDEVFVFEKQPDPIIQTGENAVYYDLQESLTDKEVLEKLAPQWVPDGFSIHEVKVQDGALGTHFVATYLDEGDRYLMVSIIKYPEDYNGEFSVYYEKDETEVIEHKVNGITHYILTDVGSICAVWSFDDYECSISMSDYYTTDDLLRVVDSIYEK